MKIDLSVCICTYNRPKWLYECVQSVLRSGRASMEVLIVDNGSDGAGETWETIRKLQHRDSRVRCWRLEQNKPDHGSSVFQENARGRYVLMLPDDDVVMDPVWLWEVIDYMDQTQAGFCWSWTQDMSEDGSILFPQIRGHRFTQVQFDDLFPGNFVPMSACVFRREFLSQPLTVGRYFGEWELWLQILHRTRKPGVSIQRVTTALRQHPNAESQSGLVDGGFIEAHLTVWKYWIDRGFKVSPIMQGEMLQVLASMLVHLPPEMAGHKLSYIHRFQNLFEEA